MPDLCPLCLSTSNTYCNTPRYSPRERCPFAHSQKSALSRISRYDRPVSKPHRLFLAQDTLDLWMSDEQAVVDGEELTLTALGQRFHLTSAVYFAAELEGGDAQALLGTVKDHEQLAELGAEHVADSVLLGETAYTVAEGFLATPIFEEGVKAPASTGDAVFDQIGRFFLGR